MSNATSLAWTTGDFPLRFHLFRFGFGRIHSYAGEYTGGELWVLDEFEDAERAFWAELFDRMPVEIREQFGKQIDSVQDAES
jgi:hypothetical protein